jgi:transposase
MTNIKEKTKTRETISFAGQTINIGLDVHKKNWSASIYLEDKFVKTFHQESTGTILLQHLKTNYPDANYNACYEAGFCGFSVQRELTSLGIACSVVNAADVPQTNKGMLSKTDAADSRRIGEAFSKGLLKAIYIPKSNIEADRNLVRYRKRVQEDLKAKKQGIKSCLFILGLKIPTQHDKSYWTNNFITWLKELDIADESNRVTVSLLVEDVLLLRKRLFETNKRLRTLSISENYAASYILITSTPGIGLITAMTMLTEIGDINRFDSFTKFNSFIGLCPSEYSSGERVHKGKMTHRAHKTLRSLIIEAAWIAIRLDPALTLKYHELLKTKTGKRAIVVVARKLLSRLFTVWKTNIEYEKGVVK